MGKKEYIKTILLLAGMIIIGIASIDLYLPSMPMITDELNSTHAVIQLTVGLYMLGLGVGQFIFGPLIDHYGRRPIFFTGLIIYMLASIGCMFTHSALFLNIVRVIQALGISSAFVISVSATRDFDDPAQRANTMSYVSMAMSISPILAPILGAVLQDAFGWRSTFLVMLLFAIGLGAFAWVELKESRYRQDNRDKKLQLFSPYAAVIKSKVFWLYTLIATITFSALMGFVINSAYFYIDLAGLGPTGFSLMFGANAVMIIVGNYAGILLRDKISMDANILTGAVIMFIAGAVQAILFLDSIIDVLSIFLPMLFVSLGSIITMSAANSLCIQPFTDLAGTASGLASTVRQILSSIVASFIGLSVVLHPSVLPVSIVITGLIAALVIYYHSFSFMFKKI